MPPRRRHRPAPLQVASIPGPGLSEVAEGRVAVYNDFRMAQIKSLAFLTVIARSSNLQPLMQPHKDAICGAIVRVMQTVPDVLTTRKELLIALRNILPTPFRGGAAAVGGGGWRVRVLVCGCGCGGWWAACWPASLTPLMWCALRLLCRTGLLPKMDVLLDEQVLLGAR